MVSSYEQSKRKVSRFPLLQQNRVQRPMTRKTDYIYLPSVSGQLEANSVSKSDKGVSGILPSTGNHRNLVTNDQFTNYAPEGHKFKVVPDERSGPRSLPNTGTQEASLQVHRQVTSAPGRKHAQRRRDAPLPKINTLLAGGQKGNKSRRHHDRALPFHYKDGAAGVTTISQRPSDVDGPKFASSWAEARLDHITRDPSDQHRLPVQRKHNGFVAKKTAAQTENKEELPKNESRSKQASDDVNTNRLPIESQIIASEPYRPQANHFRGELRPINRQYFFLTEAPGSGKPKSRKQRRHADLPTAAKVRSKHERTSLNSNGAQAIPLASDTTLNDPAEGGRYTLEDASQLYYDEHDRIRSKSTLSRRDLRSRKSTRARNDNIASDERVLTDREATIYRQIQKVYGRGGRNKRRQTDFFERLEMLQLREWQRQHNQEKARVEKKRDEKRRQQRQLQQLRSRFEDEQVRRFRSQYVSSKVVAHEWTTRHVYGLPEGTDDPPNYCPIIRRRAKPPRTYQPAKQRKKNLKKYAAIFNVPRGPTWDPRCKTPKLKSDKSVVTSIQADDEGRQSKPIDIAQIMRDAERVLRERDGSPLSSEDGVSEDDIAEKEDLPQNTQAMPTTTSSRQPHKTQTTATAHARQLAKPITKLPSKSSQPKSTKPATLSKSRQPPKSVFSIFGDINLDEPEVNCSTTQDHVAPSVSLYDHVTPPQRDTKEQTGQTPSAGIGRRPSSPVMAGPVYDMNIETAVNRLPRELTNSDKAASANSKRSAKRQDAHVAVSSRKSSVVSANAKPFRASDSSNQNERNTGSRRSSMVIREQSTMIEKKEDIIPLNLQQDKTSFSNETNKRDASDLRRSSNVNSNSETRDTSPETGERKHTLSVIPARHDTAKRHDTQHADDIIELTSKNDNQMGMHDNVSDKEDTENVSSPTDSGIESDVKANRVTSSKGSSRTDNAITTGRNNKSNDNENVSPNTVPNRSETRKPDSEKRVVPPYRKESFKSTRPTANTAVDGSERRGSNQTNRPNLSNTDKQNGRDRQPLRRRSNVALNQDKSTAGKINVKPDVDQALHRRGSKQAEKERYPQKPTEPQNERTERRQFQKPHLQPAKKGTTKEVQQNANLAKKKEKRLSTDTAKENNNKVNVASINSQPSQEKTKQHIDKGSKKPHKSTVPPSQERSILLATADSDRPDIDLDSSDDDDEDIFEKARRKYGITFDSDDD